MSRVERPDWADNETATANVRASVLNARIGVLPPQIVNHLSGSRARIRHLMTTVEWQELAPGRVIIRQPSPKAARLFGLPFLAAGGYFLYQFVGGLIHPGELTIAGWILLPLMAGGFLVPGWVLATFRKQTTIDTAARGAIEDYNFLLYT